MSLFLPSRRGPDSRAIAAVQEAGPIRIDQDDDLYRSSYGALRDLIGGALHRAQEMSVHLYRANPLANRAIKIYTTYMAGSGFALSCNNPEVQQVAEEFWTAERNRLDRNHRNLARSHLLFGESILPVAADETGNTTIGLIDPARVSQILRNPLNNLILDQVLLTNDLGHELEPLLVVRTQTDPFEGDAGLMMGNTFAHLHDRIGAASRGTPFLLPIIDWLDGFDQVLWELLERLKAIRAFYWDVEVQGGQTELDDIEKRWGHLPPRPGSIRYHSTGVTVKAEAPVLGASEDVAAARFMLRHIATGAGLAPHWLGDPEDANRATAESMDDPVLRAIEDVQTEWKTIAEDAIRFAVDQKVKAKTLPTLVDRHTEDGQPTGDFIPAREAVQVQVPALSDDDVVAAAGALAQVANAFVQLDLAGAAGPEVFRRVVRQMLPALGIPADELPEPDDDDGTEDTSKLGKALQSLEAQGRRSRAWDGLMAQLSQD